jgi:hypothetical protein
MILRNITTAHEKFTFYTTRIQENNFTYASLVFEICVPALSCSLSSSVLHYNHVSRPLEFIGSQKKNRVKIKLGAEERKRLNN